MWSIVTPQPYPCSAKTAIHDSKWMGKAEFQYNFIYKNRASLKVYIIDP